MRPPQSTTIGAWRYTVRPLPAGQGLALLTRLTRILGGASVGVAASGASIARAVEGVIDRADPDAVVAIARELAGSAEVVKPGGKPAKLDEVFDLHFAGDYEPMFAFLRFALEVNYRPFVEGLGRRVAEALAALALALKKPDAQPAPVAAPAAE